MPSRFETFIRVDRDPSRPVPIEPYLRARRIKQRRATIVEKIQSQSKRLAPTENADEVRGKAIRRKLRHFQDNLTATRVATVLVPVVVAGTIALHSHVNQSVSETPKETNTLNVPESQSDVVVERNITIRPGYVDIKPGAKMRTSPYIEDANIAGITRETIRVYNPKVVLGAKADPTVRTSSDRLYPNNDQWFSFEVGGQQKFVNAGPATKDVVDTQYAGELISVNEVRSGHVSYYEGPNGQGYTPTFAEIAPRVSK